MSHFTTVKTKIVDKECLKRTIEELGYNYEDVKTKIKGYNEKTIKADIVIKTKGIYDIGCKWNGDNYDIVADWWGVEQGSSIKEQTFISELTQKYACNKTKDVLNEKGFVLAEEKVNDKNEIVLTVRQW